MNSERVISAGQDRVCECGVSEANSLSESNMRLFGQLRAILLPLIKKSLFIQGLMEKIEDRKSEEAYNFF